MLIFFRYVNMKYICPSLILFLLTASGLCSFMISVCGYQCSETDPFNNYLASKIMIFNFRMLGSVADPEGS